MLLQLMKDNVNEKQTKTQANKTATSKRKRKDDASKNGKKGKKPSGMQIMRS